MNIFFQQNFFFLTVSHLIQRFLTLCIFGVPGLVDSAINTLTFPHLLFVCILPTIHVTIALNSNLESVDPIGLMALLDLPKYHSSQLFWGNKI